MDIGNVLGVAQSTVVSDMNSDQNRSHAEPRENKDAERKKPKMQDIEYPDDVDIRRGEQKRRVNCAFRPLYAFRASRRMAYSSRNSPLTPIDMVTTPDDRMIYVELRR